MASMKMTTRPPVHRLGQYPSTYMVLALTLILPSGDSQEIRRNNCPFQGRLALRPVDPVIFVGGTTRLCCQPIDLDNEGQIRTQPWTRENFNLIFFCSANNGIVMNGPVRPVTDRRGPVCVDMTATALTPGVLCTCRVQGQPHCQASQCLTVDEPLPSRLEIKCITYGDDNVTCTSLNLPRFSYPERVSHVITWKQVDFLTSLSQSRSKVCSRIDSCVLTANDGIMFGLPLTFNISHTLMYNKTTASPSSAPYARGNDVVSVSSEWLMFDMEAHVKLEPLQASVVDRTDTDIRISWAKQYQYFGDKVIRVSYNAADRGSETMVSPSWNHVEVREPMDFSPQPVVYVVSNLQPSTTYDISLVTRPVGSDIWSDPVKVTATTRSPVITR